MPHDLNLARRKHSHILHMCITLQQANSDIAGLGERKLLPNADAGPAVERQELPSYLPVFPSLGNEFVGVWAPDVASAMHDVDAVVY